ncbi:hypothetical protein [Sphaerisporangium sp. NPDC051011]|uniref:hypothetical protein n=1 Tax=Sphaerisporangium sp. NPDC051011 TaxID=3155792 RepID=UPI0033EF1709
MVRITAEWALWGKRPGTADGDDVLACSDGRFDRDDFGEIIARYTPGAPANLPRVTISWVNGHGDTPHVGMAVQEWSAERDGMGRDIALTRYFCLPYAELARGPVDYETLYRALAPRTLPAAGLLTADVAALDVEETTGRADQTAMGAAALLLTGDPVCVVGAEGVPMPARLRFLDSVAALLPYGLRSRLTLSTWTDSASRHRIKLSFARHAPEGAHVIGWGEPVRVAEAPETVRRYHDLLADHPRLGDLVARFARDTTPRSLRSPDIAELDDPSPGGGSGSAPPQTLGGLLLACADGVDEGDTRRVARCLSRLGSLPRTGDAAERDALRRIVRDRRILVAARSLDPALEARLYPVVLDLAYGPDPTVDDFEDLRRNADHWLSPQLAMALSRMAVTDPAVTLRLAAYLPPGELVKVLAPLPTGDLVAAAVREPLDRQALDVMCAELSVRGDDPAGRPAVHAALRRHGYAVAAVHWLHPGDPEGQIRRFHALLAAAHGPVVEARVVAEDFPAQPDPAYLPLLAALAALCSPDARRELTETVFAGMLRRADISEETVGRALSGTPGGGEEASAARAGNGRRFGLFDRRRSQA